MHTPEALQSSQYEFPYHHIPFLDGRGRARRTRILPWGLEYLCYTSHIVELIGRLQPQTMLDVGCGDGLLISRLTGTVPGLTGIDMDQGALLFAKAFAPSATFIDGDVAGLEQQFDLVTAIEVLEHIPDGDDLAFLRACGDRVAPGGTLLLSVPTINVPLNAKHYRHYDHRRLESDLKAALPEFTVQSLDYFYRRSRAEDLYKRLTGIGLVQGDISPIRNLLWRHVSRRAPTATAGNGLHLIAVLSKPA